jgi:light-regulated signal transduction histidine kinase (bacteriophytochrome)
LAVFGRAVGSHSPQPEEELRDSTSTAGCTTLVNHLPTLPGSTVKYSTSDPAIIRINGEINGGFAGYPISDNEIGIDMKYANRVFELFKRFDNVKKNIDGTGVGLTIVKRIIEKTSAKNR